MPRLTSKRPLEPDAAIAQVDAAGKVSSLAQAAALDLAGQLATARSVRLRREELRLARRYGRDSDAVRQAEARTDRHKAWVRALDAEQQRAAIQPPAIEKDAAIVYGRIRGADGKPLPATVLDAVDAAGAALGRTTTRPEGDYVLQVKVAAPTEVILRLQRGGAAARLPTELDKLTLAAGTRAYQEYVLADKEAPPSPQPQPQPQPPAEFDMPNVVGQPQARAVEILRKLGLTRIKISEAAGGIVGVVAAQIPPAGRKITVDATVELTVGAAATNTVEVPNLRGMIADEAVTTLNRVNLRPGQISGDPRRGKVAEQKPAAGSKVAPGTTVDLKFG